MYAKIQYITLWLTILQLTTNGKPYLEISKHFYWPFDDVILKTQTFTLLIDKLLSDKLFYFNYEKSTCIFITINLIFTLNTYH